jgi:hypothetical protein
MEDITNLKMCYDFFVTKSGSEYQAYNGKTGVLQFSGTNFGTVVNSCIGTFTYVGSILLDTGEFTMTSAGPAIDFNGKSVHLKGSGRGTNNIWSTYGTQITVPTGYADYVITNSNITSAAFGIVIEDLSIYGNTKHTPLGGIKLCNSWGGVIRNVGITRFHTNTTDEAINACAITLEDTSGTGLGCYYNIIENPYIKDCTIGINVDYMANATCVFGGLIEGYAASNPQYGIVEDNAGTLAVYATDIVGFDAAGQIAVWLKAEMYGSSNARFIGARFEENETHVKTDNAGGYAKFFGCTFAGTTIHGGFTFAAGGGYNLFNGCNIDSAGTVTEGNTGAARTKFIDCDGRVTNNKGVTAAIADGAAITHGLVDTPLGAVANGSVANEFISVITLDTDHFHVAIKKHDGSAGTNQVVYWNAWC